MHRCKQVAAGIRRALFNVQFPLRNLHVPKLQDSEATTSSSTPPASVCSFPCSLLAPHSSSSQLQVLHSDIPFFTLSLHLLLKTLSSHFNTWNLRSPSRFTHSDTHRFWVEATSVSLLLNLFAEGSNLIRFGHLTKTNTRCCFFPINW